MIVGIDASRAFLKKRTGIEEYSYQVLKHLRLEIPSYDKVVLYLRPGQETILKKTFPALPIHWRAKALSYRHFWTQAGLSWELLKNPIDVLFVPAHTIPIIHPARSIVVVHGLEYEIVPQAYTRWERFYLRQSIKKSCQWAKKIIAVSHNTKKDLIRLYKINPQKIEVVYEGFALNNLDKWKTKMGNQSFPGFQKDLLDKPFFLFVGRLEERKNVVNIVKAFSHYRFQNPSSREKLILAGKKGYNFEAIQKEINRSNFSQDIVLKGYISDQEKYFLYSSASLFLFPSLYEGFGLPVLEAQASGTPVITSNLSSLPEITDKDYLKRKPTEKNLSLSQQLKNHPYQSALLVNPRNPREIAQAIELILKNSEIKKTLIHRGKENLKRFSWDKTTQAIGEIIKHGT